MNRKDRRCLIFVTYFKWCYLRTNCINNIKCGVIFMTITNLMFPIKNIIKCRLSLLRPPSYYAFCKAALVSESTRSDSYIRYAETPG